MKPEDYEAMKLLTDKVNEFRKSTLKAFDTRDKFLRSCMADVEKLKDDIKEIHETLLTKPDIKPDVDLMVSKFEADLSAINKSISLLDERTIVLIEDVKFVDEPLDFDAKSLLPDAKIPLLSDAERVVKRPLTQNDLDTLGYNKLKKICFNLGCKKYTETRDFYVKWLQMNKKFIDRKIMFNPMTNKITIGG